MKLEGFKIASIKGKSILILDFGSQYTQLIARRLRELGIYCEIHPYYVDVAIVDALKPCGIILSGGPSTVTLANSPKAPEWVYQVKLPLLGICYGMQTMAMQLGGEVVSSVIGEFGYTELVIQGDSCLLNGIADKTNHHGYHILDVWMSHADKVVRLPPGFKAICTSNNTEIAGMADEERHWYGLQFHPEVTHTPKGFELLKRFTLDICGASTDWTAGNIINDVILSVRQQVGTEHVLLGLSGGVDSSVVAALLQRAIGEQLTCVFVDTGLLRHNEVQQVKEMFQEHLGIQVIWVDAETKFLEALQGVTCPEEKRKIIGRTFIEVFDNEAKQLPKVAWLAQGTIYPDVIESAQTDLNGASVVIKSHHNVGGLPKDMHLKLLEPIRELFKDEVRRIGIELGLSPVLIHRHPFPGPGLGVRILGEIKKEFADILRHADAIFIEELIAKNLYHTVSQAFAVFLPIKSVGVMGDGRHYGYVICLRAVETIDFMTAHWSPLSWDFLSHVSHRIINEVNGVSRVTYDISGKPPATIEWE